uniref:Ig-like domain-containing protein n=1 Tax=Sparus aurata TaxID=8175 RepID=A0A671TNK0_SPAAU
MYNNVLLSTVCSSVLLAAETQLIGSHQPIVALVGDDVLLPCHLEPPLDVTKLSVEWRRGPALVHVYRSRGDDPKQNPSYSLRTRLFMDELPHGSVSMQIFRVKLSDAGSYKCSLPAMKKEAEVELIVGTSKMSPKHSVSSCEWDHSTQRLVYCLGAAVAQIFLFLIIIEEQSVQ